MLLATLIFFVIDLYYFVWVTQLKHKLPEKMGSYVGDAVLGYTSKMSREMYHGLDKGARSGVTNARSKMNKAKEDAIQAASDANKKRKETNAAKKAKKEKESAKPAAK